MDREELMEILRAGPTVIHMNDGKQYQVESMEMITVSSMAAHVLRRLENGELRAIVLPLVTMTGAENIAIAKN